MCGAERGRYCASRSPPQRGLRRFKHNKNWRQHTASTNPQLAPRGFLSVTKTGPDVTFSAALLSALLLSSSASAIEAGGVRFDDKISTGGDLIANGAGVRTKYVIDVYAIALYLPARATTTEAIAAQNGNRRIAVQLLRDVSAGAAFFDGLLKI